MPPAIGTEPQDETICATYPVSFTVAASGDDLTYQWFHNGSPLSDNSNISGSQSLTLDILQADPIIDAGSYYVIVTGSATCGLGVPSATVTLTVNQDIVITSQPAPVTVCPGGKAVFTINASGTGISYQWFKGNSPLSTGGAISIVSTATSSTLTINPVTAADADNNYNVVVTSPSGSCPGANSTPVALVVNPIPTVNAVTNKVICNGAPSGNISFSSPVAGTVYNWTNSDASIGLAANGSGNIATFTATNAGTAPVTATITVTPTYTNSGTPSATCNGKSCNLYHYG